MSEITERVIVAEYEEAHDAIRADRDSWRDHALTANARVRVLSILVALLTAGLMGVGVSVYSVSRSVADLPTSITYQKAVAEAVQCRQQLLAGWSLAIGNFVESASLDQPDPKGLAAAREGLTAANTALVALVDSKACPVPEAPKRD